MYYLPHGGPIPTRPHTSRKDLNGMKTFILVTASLILASCAATQTGQVDEPPVQRTYRTGSNLPVRDNDVSAVKQADPKVILAPAPFIPSKGGGQ